MPDVSIKIGGRSYEIACAEGEEGFLRSAAAQLDAEAEALIAQAGRLPEARVLLMAGLMLADRITALDDRARRAEAEAARAAAELAELRAAPPPPPERIEVPVVPRALTEALAELTARAEALAGAAEEKLTG